MAWITYAGRGGGYESELPFTISIYEDSVGKPHSGDRYYNSYIFTPLHPGTQLPIFNTMHFHREVFKIGKLTRQTGTPYTYK